jgi:hypothetical protein
VQILYIMKKKITAKNEKPSRKDTPLDWFIAA